MSSALLMSVDIGTGSVRAGLFTPCGKLLGMCVTPIGVYRSDSNSDIYEQCSTEIWEAITTSMRCAIERTLAKLDNTDIAIIGFCFDATCSLSFADDNGHPLALTTSNPSESFKNNVIMWLDHRAVEETKLINNSKHVALMSYGGGLSLEMEPPKLMWVKAHYADVWSKTRIVLDLADMATYMLTGRNDIRSVCTMACKWAFDSKQANCRKNFWDKIGMIDVFDRFLSNCFVIAPGKNIKGDAFNTLKKLGLPVSENVGVSAGVVDAYAGALGCLATNITLNGKRVLPCEMGAMICGTSTCLFVFTESSEKSPPSVNGIWGPFWNVIGNDLWAYECGQSIAGKLLDWLFEFHPAGREIVVNSRSSVMLEHLTNLASKNHLSSIHLLTKDVHICPDFHGNRSPLARPDMRGMIVGMDVDLSVDSLAVLYLATIQSLAYNVRYMLETLNNFGIDFPKVMVVCGGLSRDSLYIQTHSDVLSLPFVVPNCSEPVLLGCAILGATASGLYTSVNDASSNMASDCDMIEPRNDTALTRFHRNKYKVYRKLLANQLEILSLMND